MFWKSEENKEDANDKQDNHAKPRPIQSTQNILAKEGDSAFAKNEQNMSDNKQKGQSKTRSVKAGAYMDPERSKRMEELQTKQKNEQALKSFYNLRGNQLNQGTKGEKPRLRLTKLQKDDNERIRRFSVRIWNIQLQNLSNERFDPFIQFNVGGDFNEQIKYDKKHVAYKCTLGKKGLVFATHAQANVGANEKANYTSKLNAEIDATYLQIQDESLEIEIWDQEAWQLNDFRAFHSIPLHLIANGSIQQQILIMKPNKKDDKPFCQVSFNMILQEIWDFRIGFSDWKAINAVSHTRQAINSQLKLSLLNQNGNKKYNSVLTDYKAFESSPHWATIADQIQFRGTIADLEEQSLQIEMFDAQTYRRHEVAKQVVQLMGVVSTGVIKTELLYLQNPKNENNNTNLNNKQESESLLDNNVIDINNIKVEGKMVFGGSTKFCQRGEWAAMVREQSYFCVRIGRVEKLPAPEETDAYHLWAEVDWGGLVKSTRVVENTLQPDFDETLYFRMPIPKRSEVSASQFKQCVLSELKKHPFAQINLWSKTLSYNDNLGSTVFFLKELDDCPPKELSQQYDGGDLGLLYHKTRVFDGKKKLLSSSFLSNSQIKLSIWFVPEIDFDYSQLPTKQIDQIPPQIHNITHQMHNSQCYANWKRAISHKIGISNKNDHKGRRIRRFLDFIFVEDQYKKMHFLPLFIAKTSPPLTFNKVNQVCPDEDSHYQDNQIKKKKKKFNQTLIQQDQDQETAQAPTKNNADENTNTNGTIAGSEIEELNNQQYENTIQTLKELAHFVRSIPFSKKANRQAWWSPDFFVTAKRGDTEEHAMLMTNLFLSCQMETRKNLLQNRLLQAQQNENKKSILEKQLRLHKLLTRYDPFMMENRTFLCVGSLKKSGELHLWVATFSRNFKTVRFWETRNGECYNLQCRVLESERQALIAHCCPNFDYWLKLVKDNVSLLFYSAHKYPFLNFDPRDFPQLWGILGYKDATQKAKLHNVQAKNQHYSSQQNNMKQKDLLDNANLELDDENKMAQRYVENIENISEANDNEEDQQNAQKGLDEGGDEGDNFKHANEKTIALVDINQIFRNKLKKDIGMEVAMDEDLRRDLFKRTENQDQAKLYQDNEEQKLDNRFFQEEKERQRILRENAQPDLHLKAIKDFFNEDGTPYTGTPELPYATLELMVNNRNVWANMRHHDPAHIFYHLHKTEDWMPFATYQNQSNEEQNQVDQNGQQNQNQQFELRAWNEQLDPFYKMNNMTNALNLSECKTLQSQIVKEVQAAVLQVRNTLNLQCKFKASFDPVNIELGKRLTDLENMKTGRYELQESQERLARWKMRLMRFINKDSVLKCLPVYFNDTNTAKIRTQITTQCAAFLLTKEKKSTFAICARVFPLPNRICSIRVMLAVFYQKQLDIQQIQLQKEKDLQLKREQQDQLAQHEQDKDQQQFTYGSEEQEDLDAIGLAYASQPNEDEDEDDQQNMQDNNDDNAVQKNQNLESPNEDQQLNKLYNKSLEEGSIQKQKLSNQNQQNQKKKTTQSEPNNQQKKQLSPNNVQNQSTKQQ